MDKYRLQSILQGFPDVRLVVIGDFFLDKYLIIDRRLSETSLETGLEAYQVVAKRCSPGAAGTVTNNLRALRVGTVYALGVIGDDGEGYDLKKGLQATGVNTDYLIETPDRFTPTYTKPMVLENGKEREMERQDIKNRTPLPATLEKEIIERLRSLLPHVHGVIVADQVPERNCGVITDRVREELAALGAQHPDTIIFADSRVRIGEFRSVIIKPNRHEAVRAIDPEFEGEVSLELAAECGRQLQARTGQPVFLTMSEEGILVVSQDGCEHVPSVPVTGEIDIVGAGDSVTAGIVSSLCVGASLREAALIGNLVASITIQQIGTTGTASPEQVMARFEERA
ncbi:MAG: PfkB family carbohydrate kinase [Abditibacteriales bacterium]|nr:PfkB family carbohydrate kinase [Abditibacteriales bacterium]MDW8367376.1 PfkB family carbohydrate kinase [Abditibacteriales bacterium]